MRVVFCGSGSFGLPALRALVESPHEVVKVITQPARPAGRGGKLRATPLAAGAGRLGLPVVECPDINAPEVVAGISRLGADIIFVAAFGQMIRQAARAAARLGAVNLHGSVLPALRGAAPVNWAIIRGMRRTGVTIFSLVDAMDAGPIYAVDETDIAGGETAGELAERLAALGAGLTCRTLDELADGSAEPLQQDESLATRAPKLRKSDGHIDWSADAETIGNLIHGTWPWPGGQAVAVPRAGSPCPVTIARAAAAPGGGAAAPGELDQDMLVVTGSGRLRIIEIKPAGKRLMSWQDFLNGHRLSPGDRFGGVEG